MVMKKIDRYEYLARSLISCKMVSEKQVNFIMSKFNGNKDITVVFTLKGSAFFKDQANLS